MDYVDIPIQRFEASEILMSDVSRDKLWVLRNVKSERWCHSNHAMTVSNRLVACVIGRMNDQQPAVSAELFV